MQGSDTEEESLLSLWLLSALQNAVSSKGRQRYAEPQIEEIERQVEASLSLVKVLKNALRSVNTLPVCVLVRIFSFLQEDGEDDPFSNNCQGSTHLDPNSWVNVTHVCRHWRSVAHETPSLWTRIHTHSNSAHVATFLGKSEQLPLTIFCGTLLGNGFTRRNEGPSIPQTASLLRAVRLLFTNADRISELYFHSSFPVDAVVQRDQFSRMIVPAISSKTSSTGPTSATHGVDIFRKLFSALSPQTRKLFLHGSPVAEYMINFNARCIPNNLTHLALFDQPRTSDQTKFYSDAVSFLDMVQASSNTLELLTLVRAGPVMDKINHVESLSHISKRTPIRLSMLKSLEIGDWASSGDITYFLAHLVIPGTAKRCIWGKDLKYLSSILFPVDPGTARTLGRGWDLDVRQVNFTAVKGQNMIGIYKNAVFIQGGFNFLSIYPLFRDHRRIFERVEKLCLTPAVAEAALTADEYRLIFATLPNVQHLSMFDMDVSLIFQALGLFEILTPHDVPFPELKAITIRYSRSKGHLDATSPTRDFLGNKYKLSPLSIVLGLVKLSQQRAAIGCPLDNLTFDLQAQYLSLDLYTDYLEISDHLVQYVGTVTSLDRFLDDRGEKQATNLVLDLFDGFWPSNASLGKF